MFLDKRIGIIQVEVNIRESKNIDKERDMFCEKCGVKQPDNAVFCSNCGNNMSSVNSDASAAKSVQAPVTPQPVQVSPTPVAPRPAQVPPTPVAPRPVPQVAPRPIAQPVMQAAPRPIPQVATGQVYQQQPPRIDPLTTPLSVGSYMGMFLLMAIPFVNFVMMLIWLFGSTTNKNKKNFAIAMVLFTIIMMVISFLLSGLIFAILAPLLQDMQYNTY